MQQAEEIASMQQGLLQVTKLLRTSERESVAWEGLRKDYEAKEQQAQQVIEDLMLLVQQLRLQKAEENKELKQKNKDLRGQMKELQRCVQDMQQRADAMAAVEHEIDVMRQQVRACKCFRVIITQNSAADLCRSLCREGAAA
jgi:hypothetical protein